MGEDWALEWVIQREEKNIQRVGVVWIPGPDVEREGDGFGLKIHNARNILLIALDVWFQLHSDQLPRRGRHH